MLLVLFPCPPLPVLGKQLDGDDAVANSHDILARLVDEVARRGDEKANKTRMKKQEALSLWYTTSLAGVRTVSAVWTVMTTFTRGYCDLYFPDATRDMRFLPYDCTPDAILERVREWVAARHILAGNPDAKASDHSHKDASVLYGDARIAALIQATEE